MAKWTIRIAPDVARAHKDLCKSCGVSTQAMVEATVRTQVAWFESQERRPQEDWDGDEAVLARWQAVITAARQIDAEKRSRS